MPRVYRPASGVLGKHRKPTSASQQRCCRSNIGNPLEPWRLLLAGF
jgi:hypothetical protein